MATKKPVPKKPTYKPNKDAPPDYKSAWATGRKKASEFQGGENVVLEDGSYVCQVISASINFKLTGKGIPVPNKEGKKPGFNFRFVVKRGEEQGKQPSSWYGLHSETQCSILSQQLALLFDKDPEDIGLEDLPDIAKTISENKPIVRVQCKTSNGFTNYTIREVLDDDAGEDDDE